MRSHWVSNDVKYCPVFPVAPRATFATRRQCFKYDIIDDQGTHLPQGPVRAVPAGATRSVG